MKELTAKFQNFKKKQEVKLIRIDPQKKTERFFPAPYWSYEYCEIHA